MSRNPEDDRMKEALAATLPKWSRLQCSTPAPIPIDQADPAPAIPDAARDGLDLQPTTHSRRMWVPSPELVEIMRHSIAQRGSIVVRVNPGIYDSIKGGRYRNLAGCGFSIEVTTVQAVWELIGAMIATGEQAVPSSVRRCIGPEEARHPTIWFDAVRLPSCPMCSMVAGLEGE